MLTCVARTFPRYLALVARHFLVDSVAPALRALRAGVAEAVSLEALRAFSAAELRALVGGDAASEDWSEATIRAHVLAKHGFDASSEHVRWLIETMVGFDASARRDFLLFLTGSSRLPLGGFAEARAHDTARALSPARARG